MNGYFYIAIIIVVLLLMPYLRIFRKRLSFYHRLKKICKQKNYHITGTHFGWLFSPWRYPRYDFLVEGNRVLYPVKFFACPRRTDKLLFLSDTAFYRTRRLVLTGRVVPTAANMEIPSPIYHMPAYDFSIQRDLWDICEVKPILLIHPVCLEVRRDTGSQPQNNSGDGLVMGSWDRLGQMYICTSSRFLDELATYDHDAFLYR